LTRGRGEKGRRGRREVRAPEPLAHRPASSGGEAAAAPAAECPGPPSLCFCRGVREALTQREKRERERDKVGPAGPTCRV
jgi:hypothetical protein